MHDIFPKFLRKLDSFITLLVAILNEQLRICDTCADLINSKGTNVFNVGKQHWDNNIMQLCHKSRASHFPDFLCSGENGKSGWLFRDPGKKMKSLF